MQKTPFYSNNLLVWITGLSGAGQTTLANALKESMVSKGYIPVSQYRDVLREVLGVTGKCYTFEERKKLAFCYIRLANLLAKQGVFVIVATVSMFENVRKWYQENNCKYCEVYLKVDREIRASRDPKKLYESNTDLVEIENGFDKPINQT
tara:strand:+ start:280 stop:729 length:450 start_codon:yes stop_codon:yes gene_type:complete